MQRLTRSNIKQQIEETQTYNKKDDNLKRPHNSDDSSSESDIENYLKPAHEIDLNSSFFQTQKQFCDIEKNILDGITEVKDSESSENDESEAVVEIQKIGFERMQEHLNKITEAKKHIEEYEAKKQAIKRQHQKKKQKTDDVNVAELLSLGEKLRKNVEEVEVFSSDSECGDWEEVKETKEKDVVPKKGVEIVVQMPGAIREKKGVDLVAAMKRRLNRIKKENQVFIHKVSILCWIAHGNYINTVLNNEKFLGLALSLIPSEQCYPGDRTDLIYLERILNWYRKTVESSDKSDLNYEIDKQLQIDISKKHASDKKMLVLIFICILRALGIQCRLVMSLLVLPLKPPASELCSLSTKKVGEDKGTKQNVHKKETQVKENKITNKKSRKTLEREESCNNTSAKETVKKTSVNKPEKRKAFNGTTKLTEMTKESQKKSISEKEKSIKTSHNEFENPAKKVRFAELNKSDVESQTNKKKPNLTRIKMSLRKKTKVPQTDGANDSEADKPLSSKQKPNLSKLRQNQRRIKSAPDYTETDSEDEFHRKPSLNLKNLHKKRSASASPRKIDVKNDIINLINTRICEENEKTREKLVKTKQNVKVLKPVTKKKHDSDDEFIASLKPKVKKRLGAKPKEEQQKKKNGNDVWIEAFLEAEEKWISVDVIKNQLHCVNEIYKRATQPISYILSWDNKNYIKDITKRYCPNWNTVTRKLRVDSKWWEQTLKPYVGPRTVFDREEDEELARLQLEKPLPTTISEYKNHPLYALKRHLLKFEAIYPPDAVTLGFVRNEPVYSRECVHTLHSREVWLKHAKVVRLGEKPYKIVKARPKYDRVSIVERLKVINYLQLNFSILIQY